ncbi:MAG TPA: polysaccharide deacetylase family protein [Anaerolineae bacterium]
MMAALVARAEHQAATDVGSYRRHPALLPHLGLGRFNDANLRSLLARRLLLRLHVPARAVGLVLQPLAWLRPGAQGCHDFLSDYAYWRGAQRALADRDSWQRLVDGPVILMYHAVGAQGEPPGTYIISPKRFEQQMAWLKRRRRPVIRLDVFLADRWAGRLPPARSVILTFDDGYRDNKDQALPVLRRYGFPATVFIVTGYAGKADGWDQGGELAGRPLLSWPELREMEASGISFGAHTRTHPHLSALDGERLRDEIAGSRSDLEAQLTRVCPALAYPHGDHDADVEAAVAQAGFLGACCSRADRNDPAAPTFALRRIEIRGSDSFARFFLAVWLGRRMSVWQFLTRLLNGR